MSRGAWEARGQKGFEIMGCDLNFLRKAFFKVSAVSVTKQNNKWNEVVEVSIVQLLEHFVSLRFGHRQSMFLFLSLL